MHPLTRKILEQFGYHRKDETNSKPPPEEDPARIIHAVRDLCREDGGRPRACGSCLHKLYGMMHLEYFPTSSANRSVKVYLCTLDVPDVLVFCWSRADGLTVFRKGTWMKILDFSYKEFLAKKSLLDPGSDLAFEPVDDAARFEPLGASR